MSHEGLQTRGDAAEDLKGCSQCNLYILVSKMCVCVVVVIVCVYMSSIYVCIVVVLIVCVHVVYVWVHVCVVVVVIVYVCACHLYACVYGCCYCVSVHVVCVWVHRWKFEDNFVESVLFPLHSFLPWNPAK